MTQVYAYATVNKTTGLGASAWTLTNGPADDTRLYLNDGRMDRQVVFTSATGANIHVDLGSAMEIRGFALLNHNMGTFTSPIFSCEAGNSSNLVTDYILLTGASETVPQTAPAHRDFVVQFNTGVSRRYWRLNLSWTGSTVLRVGEVFLYGAPTVLTRGFTDGTGETEEFVTVPVQMRMGDVRTSFLAGPIRSKRLRAQDYSSANNAELLTMFRACRGGATPLLWINDYSPGSFTAARKDVMLGRIGPEYSWAYSDYDLVQPPEIVIRSLGRAVGQ